MRGDIAFEKFGDIDLSFVTEAAPKVPTNARKSPSFFQRHSGLVAALLCGILAVGIYVGILITRPDTTPLPPVGTSEGESDITIDTNNETTEPSTEQDPPIETEATTFSETQAVENIEIPENFANQHFVVEKIGDTCYLNLFRKHQKQFGYMSIPSIYFDDIDDMFYSIRTGDLAEAELLQIDSGFFTENGYIVFDTSKLYAPILSADGAITGVNWNLDYYGVYYTHPDFNKPIYMQIYSDSKEAGWANERLSSHVTTTFIDGMSAAIEEKNDTKEIYLAHINPHTNCEWFVYVESKLSPSIDAYTIRTVKIQGSNNGVYFDIILNSSEHGIMSFELTKNWIESFNIQPFTPSRVPNMPQLTPEPFTIEETNGKYYLTLPEWDGSIPEAYLPVEDAQPFGFSFLSFKEMQNIMSQTSMMLYSQILFKRNAGEDKRIEVPNPQNVLLANRISGNRDFSNIILNEDSGYTATTIVDELGFSNITFHVTSCDTWQQKYTSWIPFTEQEKITKVYATQGTYDGLPCTYYLYHVTYENAKGNTVSAIRNICHLDLSTEQERKEIFLYFEFSLYEILNINPEDNEIQADTHLTSEEIEFYLRGIDVIPAIFGEKNGTYYYYDFTYEFSIDASYDIENIDDRWSATYIKTPTADDLAEFIVESLLP